MIQGIRFITWHNTKLFEHSTSCNGELIHNRHSHEIKSVKSIMKFKKIINNFLLDKSFILWKNL